jgi:hypothetical protein
MYNEELLSDEQYRQLSGNQQSELIANHCADIEGQICSASSLQEAIHLKELACTRFEQACSSRVVRKALIMHVEELVVRYWRKK